MMEIALQIVAGVVSILIGLAAVVLRPRGIASWSFFLGMLLLGGERFLEGLVTLSPEYGELRSSLTYGFLGKSVIPFVWLVFSLAFARGNRLEFLRRWKWMLLLSLLIPLMLMGGIFGSPWSLDHDGGKQVIRFLLPGKFWVAATLMVTIGVLINLEKTFRSAVGMVRWRIKYLFLGTGLIFGVKVFTQSQILLFSNYNSSMSGIDAVALILGSGLIGVGHFRSGFKDLDLYPSRTVLQGSFTLILAVGYFLIVGLLAQMVSFLGGIANLQAQAFLILIGLVGSSVLLLSDRFGAWLQGLVSRHFRRPEHDFRKLWTDFTRRTSSTLSEIELGRQAAEVVSENFQVLGVTVLKLEPDGRAFTWLHSTDSGELPMDHVPLGPMDASRLSARSGPYILERDTDSYSEVLREACPSKFGHGGDRVAVPLKVADRVIGVMVLADRVNGVPYSHEELDLLACIGDQFGAGLLNCSLTDEVLQAKELEAFQTLSTFFVHDLKNAANSLNLMLQNLPVHFDDPDFREDAFRSIGRTADRINKMILNLSSLRLELQLRRAPTRFDLLVEKALCELELEMGEKQRLVRRIDPLPEAQIDAAMMRSVLTNLVTNARESIAETGSVTVSLQESDGVIRLVVEDEGSGMTSEFIRSQLFRPFHSTKTKGLGIGMFQCKKVIEAHQGSFHVESEVGAGTRVCIEFPVYHASESLTIPS